MTTVLELTDIKKISEKLNIQIEVESKLSKGSTFRLVFPENLTKM